MKLSKAIVLFAFLMAYNLYGQAPNVDLRNAIRDLDYTQVEVALNSGANPNATFGPESVIGFVLGSMTSKYYQLLDDFDMPNNRVPQTMEDNVVRILALMFDKGAHFSSADSLYIPISLGCSKITDFLLSKGFDPNRPTDEYATPMSQAIKYDRTDIVQLLLQYGATPLSLSEESQVLFVAACSAGNVEEAITLLAGGARINGLDPESNTGLMAASEARQANLVRILIAQGADPNIESKANFWRYPIIVVSYNCAHTFGQTEEWSSILKVMIGKGAFVSVQDAIGNSALHWVCNSKDQNIDLAELLLKAGAKVMQKNKNGQAPMDLAVSGELIKKLKSYGAVE